ncbi:uncharacterized protein AMSG_11835 [Thecamonas trahens ATCC 50062]|uniref:Uncharacterized protein n=1 Tax=Thecamonas trahens ATCC 50062 TaxID=461836 RepID=A0A0L0D8T5_THETB|nr:hypothetical protein AMSG_11835 [Thecamonas trahens ATCC 50062]KNC48491.1 hypothetical protein AMSG_11835 [Thecamonas trahens ATCC 50062]|eukprot:XP_013758670.1 hypothetical protein AMSG_11835 [Thecamonas trahens ATCC 50062]
MRLTVRPPLPVDCQRCWACQSRGIYRLSRPHRGDSACAGHQSRPCSLPALVDERQVAVQLRIGPDVCGGHAARICSHGRAGGQPAPGLPYSAHFGQPYHQRGPPQAHLLADLAILGRLPCQLAAPLLHRRPVCTSARIISYAVHRLRVDLCG